MYLYHFVLNIKRLESILQSDFIIKDQNINIPCIYLSRNSNYLNERGIRIVLDYDKLKYNYKIKPFCIHGWYKINLPEHKWNKINHKDEMEERCYHNISINKCCVRIDIDNIRYKDIKIDHNLINITKNFKVTFNGIKYQ